MRRQVEVRILEPIIECEECGRTGNEGFVWFQGEIMLCADEAACNQRAAEKRRA